MKTRSRWLAALWLAGVIGWGWGLGSSAAAEAPLRDTMRFKLHYAQGVLEGITTENFPLVATNAQKLAQLARSADWQSRATPDYERLTADFLRQTEALTRAAKKQSADAATVAYFQLTVSCVNCHRHLRGVEPVRFRFPETTEPAAAGLATARPPARRGGGLGPPGLRLGAATGRGAFTPPVLGQPRPLPARCRQHFEPVPTKTQK